ncbi:MAG: hypothetical protein R2708_05550 [Vicinamibacterales bacterium]
MRPWIKVQYPDYPAVGNLEAAYFWPERWKPEYPNAAFDNARPDDLFWAARRVMAVSDEAIRAVVATADYSERGPPTTWPTSSSRAARRGGPAVADRVNPVGDFALASDGTLTFSNVAVDTRRATRPDAYEIAWGVFDNATGTTRRVGASVTVERERATAPAGVLDAAFVEAAIHTRHPAFPAWRRPVIVHFRGPHRAGPWSACGATGSTDLPARGRLALARSRRRAALERHTVVRDRPRAAGGSAIPRNPCRDGSIGGAPRSIPKAPPCPALCRISTDRSGHRHPEQHPQLTDIHRFMPVRRAWHPRC